MKNEKLGEPKYYESMYEFIIEQWSDDYIGTVKCGMEPITDLNLDSCEGIGLTLPIGDDYFAEEILPWDCDGFEGCPDNVPEDMEHDGKTYEFFEMGEDDGIATPCYLRRDVGTGSFLHIGANDVIWLLDKRVGVNELEEDKYECIGIYATFEEAKKVAEKS